MDRPISLQKSPEEADVQEALDELADQYGRSLVLVGFQHKEYLVYLDGQNMYAPCVPIQDVLSLVTSYFK
jgi:basic membrane lipoprotein Med (substrate-binding protein (PBP1-ABC) superfamily)